MMIVMGNMLPVTVVLEEQVGRGKAEDRENCEKPSLPRNCQILGENISKRSASSKRSRGPAFNIITGSYDEM